VRIFELDEVVSLLRQGIDREGSQTAWSTRNGINRTLLNQVLMRRRQPTARMIAALNLRRVFVLQEPQRRLGRRKSGDDTSTSAGKRRSNPN
jgi:hypothetical protein